MVKPYLKVLKIECWIHKGRLGSAYVSLCLFHQKVESGAEILRALEELQGEQPGVQRTVTFAGSQRKRAVGTMCLRYVPADEELRVINIAPRDGAATIEMTEVGLRLLHEAIGVWRRGGEDFGVHADHAKLRKHEYGKRDLNSAELWFWGPGYYGP